MHIAIEGMDGAGKTSQAKRISDILGGEFIPKSFHEMKGSTKKYDGFISINEYSRNVIQSKYGLRQSFFKKKNNDELIITDRFYISNYWSRADSLSVEYFRYISYRWGKPDIMILLYADQKILYDRIYSRNLQDKDLIKSQISSYAYNKMIEFIRCMNFTVLLINNSNITFEETSEIIANAHGKGVDYCVDNYDVCSLISPYYSKIENDTGVFYINNNELLYCVNKTDSIYIPKEVKYINEDSFKKLRNCFEIVISENVKDIADYAFDNVGINSIRVLDTNSNYSTKDGMLFSKDMKKIISCFTKNIREVNVEYGVEEISNRAFANHPNIEYIELPMSIKYIGYGAFINCKKLCKIYIYGDSLKDIKSGAFVGCDKLIEIVIKNGEKYFIQDSFLMDNKGIIFYFGNKRFINKMRLPSCEYIYPFAFYNRLNCKNLIIGCKKVGALSFEGCSISNIKIIGDIHDFGERCFYEVNLLEVDISRSKVVPEFWKNSFIESVTFFVKKDIQKKYMHDNMWRDKNILSAMGTKSERILCGETCADYILKMSGISLYKYKYRNYWIMDLARNLQECCGYTTHIYYYNSRLMLDFYKKVLPSNIDVTVCEYIKSNGEISEKFVTYTVLQQMFKENKWVLLCLRSDILFDDDRKKDNNHYVVLNEVEDNEVSLVVPGKNKIYIKYITKENLMNALIGNGQWILVCR